MIICLPEEKKSLQYLLCCGSLLDPVNNTEQTTLNNCRTRLENLIHGQLATRCLYTSMEHNITVIRSYHEGNADVNTDKISVNKTHVGLVMSGRYS